MTENERVTINGKEVTLYREVETNLYRFSKDAVDMLLEALEEREQYRAIGTIEEFKALKNMTELKDYVEGQEIEPYGRPRVYMGIEQLNELKAYRDFGTLAQIRVLNDRYHELIERPSEKEVRAKAIDEFVERMKRNYQAYDIDLCLQDNDHLSYTNSCIALESYIDEIAEQMKAGGKNE